MQKISVPYGAGEQTAQVEDSIKIQLVEAKKSIVGEALPVLLRKAMDHPYSAPRLEELAKARDTVVIVVNDHTRPGPNRLIMKEVMGRLKSVGIRDNQVKVLFATGSHRSPTIGEMDQIVGEEYRKRLQMVAHDCRDDANMVYVGDTDTGMPIYLNRLVTECSLLITTGLIAPIHTAGYSGGRKSIVPGVASLKTLHIHHSFPVYQYEPAMGFIYGNPFHEIALAAAKKVGVKYIVNAVQDPNKQFINFVAGDLEIAHQAGVAMCKAVSEVEIPKRADIIVASPGGFPRDIDLYQSQKALSVAEVIGKPGCTFIIVAECRDGFGEENFRRWMIEGKTPQEIIERYAKEGFNVGNNKAFNFARALLKGRVIVVTDQIGEKELYDAKLEWAPTLQSAVDRSLSGKPAEIITVMAQAANIIPHVLE